MLKNSRWSASSIFWVCHLTPIFLSCLLFSHHIVRALEMVLSTSPLLCLIALLMLAIYILWRQKFKKWRHLPGPFSPLMFVIMSAFTSNNPVLLRRLYRKYQKVTWLYLIYHNLHFQDGLCFLPLLRIPLLLVGDFNKMKCLCSNPGIKIRGNK